MNDHFIFDFLGDQKNNNRRERYHANKTRFKDSKNNFIDFIAMILFRISEFDPFLIGVRPKDCLFRIYKSNFCL